MGNFIALIHITIDQRVEPFKLAKEIRNSVNNFQRLHLNFFATKEYIEKNGGIKKIERFVATGIDPKNKALFITNWANFGVYDLTFGDSEPFFFTPFGDTLFPWLSIIVEGFDNDGLVYYVELPSKLGKKLMQEHNLKKMHQYHEQKEMMPELIKKLQWLL